MAEGLPVMYVTEDTTRADPDTLRRLYSTAIRAGASRVCIADTVGHATPAGAAKNVVAAGLADKCELQVAYAIGVAEPVGIYINTFGTNKIEEDKILELIRNNFDFKPKAIIERLQLRRPVFLATAAYGHFGRNEDGFSWEKTDKAETLKREAGL